MVVARSSQAVIGASDALMTAPLGEAPVAAVTTGAMNAYALVIVPMGVAFMVQSFAAQLSARGEVGAARRYAWYGLMVTAAVVVAAVASTPFIARSSWSTRTSRCSSGGLPRKPRPNSIISTAVFCPVR